MHALFEVVYQSQEGRLVTVVHWPELKNGYKPPNANLYLRQRSFSIKILWFIAGCKCSWCYSWCIGYVKLNSCHEEENYFNKGVKAELATLRRGVETKADEETYNCLDYFALKSYSTPSICT